MLAFPKPRAVVRRADAGETSVISYLRQAALWCLDIPAGSPSAIAAFLDRVPDIDAALIAEGRYFLADSRREIVGGVGWSPLGEDVRAKLLAGMTPPRAPRAAGPAILLRGFFLQERRNLKVATALLSVLEAEASRAGFASAEVVAPAALEKTFLSLGFRTVSQLSFAVEECQAVPLVHMSKVFATALCDAA